MIVEVAHDGGLLLGKDYIQGTPFTVNGRKYYTAKFLGDPITLTEIVIDKAGFYTSEGSQRWDYIAIPKGIWVELTPSEKRDVIGMMYQREGGTAMRHLFPNYGKV